MRTKIFKLMVLGGVLSFFWIISLVSTSGAANYVITDLGPGVAEDINNLGQVGGIYVPDPMGTGTAFFWDSIGGMQYIGLGIYGGVLSITNQSIIV